MFGNGCETEERNNGFSLVWINMAWYLLFVLTRYKTFVRCFRHHVLNLSSIDR